MLIQKDKTKYHQLNQQLESLNKNSKTEQLIITDGTLLDLAAALFIYKQSRNVLFIKWF